MSGQPLYVDESFRKLNAASIESASNPTRNQQIELALLYEDTPDFIKLINSLPSDVLDKELDWIWRTIFLSDSGKCAAAVLDGLTKIPSQVDNNGPLHQAAANSSPKITALLLQRGFSADAIANYENSKQVLPLNVVLTRLRFDLLSFNTVKESSAVTLVRLCQPQYRRTLETLRLIALNTTEVKREFINYLKERKMIEVGALLLVAKSKILSPSTAKGEGEFRSISEISDSYYRLKPRLELTKSKELVRKEEREMMVLFEIFDEIGDKLAALLRLDFTQTCLANCSTLLAASIMEGAYYRYLEDFYYNHSLARSETESYYLKGAIDECEKTIRTSDMLPIWVKEEALTGLGVKPDRCSRLTYPFVAEILSNTSIVSLSTPRSASPMPENMTLLRHLLKKTAPFLGTIKRMFRRG